MSVFLTSFFYFNPRTREGCDRIHYTADPSKRRISIHAPVKGATPVSGPFCLFLPDFNPRTREGCDLEFFFLEFFHGIISIHAPVKGATPMSSRC